MINTIVEDNSFFSQHVSLKKRYTNKELIYFRYFYHKTKIYPEHIIVFKNFLFFFVRPFDYFKAKLHLNSFRKNLYNKVMLIRAEPTFVRLLFGFFPDPYIHDIKVEFNIYSKKKIVEIGFLSFEERGIAVGRNGDYIKAVNYILENYINFEESKVPVNIKCSLINLNQDYHGTSFNPKI